MISNTNTNENTINKWDSEKKSSDLSTSVSRNYKLYITEQHLSDLEYCSGIK